MAVYSRNAGSSPSNNNNNNLPQTNNQNTSVAPMMSKDIGDVIVKSLETVTETLSKDDVPVSYKDVEKAVTEGINNSELIDINEKNITITNKNAVTTKTTEKTVAGGKADAALAEKYEQEKYIKWEEFQRKVQKWKEADAKAEKQQREKDLNDIKNKVNETFATVVSGIENPLKGVSDLLDKTVKDFSTGFLAGFKDARKKRDDIGLDNNLSIPSVGNVLTDRNIISDSLEESSVGANVEDIRDVVVENGFDEAVPNIVKDNVVEEVIPDITRVNEPEKIVPNVTEINNFEKLLPNVTETNKPEEPERRNETIIETEQTSAEDLAKEFLGKILPTLLPKMNEIIPYEYDFSDVEVPESKELVPANVTPKRENEIDISKSLTFPIEIPFNQEREQSYENLKNVTPEEEYKKSDEPSEGTVKGETSQIDELIDLVSEDVETNRLSMEQSFNAADMSDLIKEERTDKDIEEGRQKQKDDEDKKDKSEDKKRQTEQLNATQSVGYAVGKVVGKFGETVLLITAISAVASQVFVFLKGQLYKMIADMPVKRDATIAKVKSAIETVPGHIKIAFSELLSKVRIMGQPIFGTMSKDDKAQLKEYQKKEETLNNLADKYGVDISTEEGKEKLKKEIVNKELLGSGTGSYGYDSLAPEIYSDLLTPTDEDERDAILERTGITKEDIARLEELNKAERGEGLFGKGKRELTGEEKRWRNTIAVKYAQDLYDREYGMTEEQQAEYEDLKERKNAKLTPEYFDKQREKLKEEQEENFQENLTEAARKRMAEGTLTAYQAAQYQEKGVDIRGLIGEWSVDEQNQGKQYQFAKESKEEHFLNNEYKDWVNSWNDFAKELKLDLGIKVENNATDPMNVNR